MKTSKSKNYREVVNQIDGSFQNLRSIENLCALLYHENSKLSRFSLIKQGEEIGKFSNPYILKRAAQPYKCFPTSKTISLKDYENTFAFSKDIFEVIKNRRSGREYDDYPISVNELYQLLFYSYGITKERNIKGEDGIWSYRAVPSGGALYPLELYVYVNKGQLSKGFYHYRPDINILESLDEKDHLEDLRRIIYAEPNVDLQNCSCIILISSVVQRILMKYGERGYRFILQEVGFVSQNISLISEAIGLSSCMIGSFIDNELNKLIRADGVLESIQGVIVIGKNTKDETEN
ncbi:SagB/ThcOx family dehydrogenase [Marinifilum sp. D737]|uniref:SagB/ThcOx family dehydrogenase n=1 Tax=Marinifilum sp. D737 TaxID=2969628 RepID=UPI00227374AF|nr:SagB/ThcOx family dehydrogenase [Marinifilum sp. D737]MCY1633350.1 SagB/ThcOx family dehydrogenase [Marinifilum sp. D737]